MSIRGCICAALLLAIAPVVCAAPELKDAKQALRRYDYAGALQTLRQLEKSQPKNAEVFGNLGEVLFALSRLRDACAAFQTAAKLNDRWASRSREVLALSEFAQGKRPEDIPPSLRARLGLLLDPPGMHVRRSKSLIVYSTTALKQAGGDVFAVKALKRILRAYSRLLKLGKSEVVPRVYLFDGASSFGAFADRLGAPGLKQAGGFYIPENRVLVVRTRFPHSPPLESGFCEAGMHALIHEGFHQAIAARVPSRNIPEWLNEGLAEYFAYCREPGSSKINAPLPPLSTPSGQLLAAYRTRIPVSLPRLIGLRYERFQDPAWRPLHYAASWSLVRYLAHGPPAKSKVLRRIFKLLKAGHTRDYAEGETIRKLNLDRLDAAWRQQAP